MENSLLKQLGLLLDPSGTITGIDLPISPTPLLADGLQRRVRMKRLTFEADLEITVIFELRVHDAAGQDLFALVQSDGTLSPSVQRERLSRLQPLEITRTTRDSFRSKLTGELVTSDALNAISELAFFQSMALSHLQAQGLPLTGTEPYLTVVYLMLANIIQEKDALNEF